MRSVIKFYVLAPSMKLLFTLYITRNHRLLWPATWPWIWLQSTSFACPCQSKLDLSLFSSNVVSFIWWSDQGSFETVRVSMEWPLDRTFKFATKLQLKSIINEINIYISIIVLFIKPKKVQIPFTVKNWNKCSLTYCNSKFNLNWQPKFVQRTAMLWPAVTPRSIFCRRYLIYTLSSPLQIHYAQNNSF